MTATVFKHNVLLAYGQNLCTSMTYEALCRDYDIRTGWPKKVSHYQMIKKSY